jgi:hypothetical protein
MRMWNGYVNSKPTAMWIYADEQGIRISLMENAPEKVAMGIRIVYVIQNIKKG